MAFDYDNCNRPTRYSDPEGSGRYWHFEYDLRGNLTKRYHDFYTSSWMTYDWDAQDRLTKVYRNDTGATIEYKYDHAGRQSAIPACMPNG